MISPTGPVAEDGSSKPRAIACPGDLREPRSLCAHPDEITPCGKFLFIIFQIAATMIGRRARAGYRRPATTSDASDSEMDTTTAYPGRQRNLGGVGDTRAARTFAERVKR